jgi:putative Mg2+ transporter-C (MgtC) family protein
MLDWKEILLRLALGAVFGAVIGMERERKHWTAGMRTHMMVSVGATLSMMVSSFGFEDIINHSHVSLDPSRIAAQVISGIGFIGAGTILFLKQGVIKGLTTASGLWTVAAIGLATGGGMYFAAAATTLLSLVILLVLQPFEKRISQRFKPKTVRIILQPGKDTDPVFQALLKADQHIMSFTVEKEDSHVAIQVNIEQQGAAQVTRIIHAIKDDPAVKEIEWHK